MITGGSPPREPARSRRAIAWTARPAAYVRGSSAEKKGKFDLWAFYSRIAFATA